MTLFSPPDFGVKFNAKYRFTLTGSYGEKRPLGHVATLDRIMNKSDYAEVVLFPKDITENKIILDDIQIDDVIEIKIDLQDAFFGNVVDREFFFQEGLQLVRVKCHGQLRRLSERFLNQVIFNGFRDREDFTVAANLTHKLPSNIQPLVSMQYLSPHGIYDIREAGSTFQNDDSKLSFLDNSAEKRFAFVFKPRSLTFEKFWFSINDPSSDGNADPFTERVRISIHDVVEVVSGIFPGEKIPGTIKTTRAGNPAERFLGMDNKETWVNAIPGFFTTSIPSDYDWIVTAVTDTVEIVDNGGTFIFGWDRHLRLNHTTGTARVVTKSPGQRLFRSSSGWMSCIFRMTSSTSEEVEGEFVLLVDGSRPLGKVLVEDGDLKLVHGGGTIIFLPGFALNTIYRFWFRVRPDQLKFDFWWHDSINGVGTLIDENLDFIDRNSFTTVPSKIDEFQVATTGGGPGTIEVGFINMNEIGNSRLRRLNSWVQVDFSDDPVDVELDKWIAVEISLPDGPFAHTLGLNFTAIDITNKTLGRPDIRTIRTGNFTGGVWGQILVVGTPAELPFFVEYADSWRFANEGENFIVDYDNQTVDWKGGTIRTGIVTSPIMTSTLFSFGPVAPQLVRIGQYANPSSNGIIEPNNEMRVSDVAEYIVSFEPTFAGVIATDFDTPSFEIPTFTVKQRSNLEALRNLGNEFKALFELTLETNPTLTFKLAKIISDIDVTNPGPDEYILTLELDLFQNDPNIARRIKTMEIGRVGNAAFTHFPVFGATPDFDAERVNWDLRDARGRDLVRPAETFPKVTDRNQLWRVSDMLRELFGLDRIEGLLTVAGYFPLDSNGRLNLNGTVRILSDKIENGLDVEGTNNVFNISRLTYKGERDETLIYVSNQNLHRATEERLSELRNLLNGIEPADPRLNPRKTTRATGSISASGNPRLYLALLSAGVEITTIGYRRILAEQRIHDDGFISYSGVWPKGIGTIHSDQHPIDECALYVNEIPTGPTGVEEGPATFQVPLQVHPNALRDQRSSGVIRTNTGRLFYAGIEPNSSDNNFVIYWSDDEFQTINSFLLFNGGPSNAEFEAPALSYDNASRLYITVHRFTDTTDDIDMWISDNFNASPTFVSQGSMTAGGAFANNINPDCGLVIRLDTNKKLHIAWLDAAGASIKYAISASIAPLTLTAIGVGTDWEQYEGSGIFTAESIGSTEKPDLMFDDSSPVKKMLLFGNGTDLFQWLAINTAAFTTAVTVTFTNAKRGLYVSEVNPTSPFDMMVFYQRSSGVDLDKVFAKLSVDSGASYGFEETVDINTNPHFGVAFFQGNFYVFNESGNRVQRIERTGFNTYNFSTIIGSDPMDVMKQPQGRWHPWHFPLTSDFDVYWANITDSATEFNKHTFTAPEPQVVSIVIPAQRDKVYKWENATFNTKIYILNTDP